MAKALFGLLLTCFFLEAMTASFKEEGNCGFVCLKAISWQSFMVFLFSVGEWGIGSSLYPNGALPTWLGELNFSYLVVLNLTLVAENTSIVEQVGIFSAYTRVLMLS